MWDTSNESHSYYYSSCFISIQNEIDRAFITMKSKNEKPPKTRLRRFPYPSITYDSFLADFAVHIFPLFVVFSFLYTTKNIIKVSLSRK